MNEEIRKFSEACIQKDEFEKLGDSKSGNKQYKIIHSVYLQLLKENRLVELLELLEHIHPRVRSWAARYTLQAYPDIAVKVLETLGDTERVIGVDAKRTLVEWRKGNLKFD